jgi:hypothetical protein
VRRRARGLALALMLFAAPAAAQEPGDVMRPCRRADLLGLWEVIRFGVAREAAVDPQDPAYRMHQRFVFRTDATMVYRASATPLTIDDERALQDEASDMTWAVEDGRLLRQRAGAGTLQRSECQVVTRPLRDRRSPVPARPGDVLLTDRTEDDRPLVRRLLRRLPPRW